MIDMMDDIMIDTGNDYRSISGCRYHIYTHSEAHKSLSKSIPSWEDILYSSRILRARKHDHRKFIRA